jgi:hypothetical protein
MLFNNLFFFFFGFVVVVNTTFIHQEQVTSNKNKGEGYHQQKSKYDTTEGMNVFSISKELKISRPYQFWTKLRICPNKKDQTSEEQGHDPCKGLQPCPKQP